MQDRPSGQMVRCTKARRMFASRACRKSIMIGKSLTSAQMKKVRPSFLPYEMLLHWNAQSSLLIVWTPGSLRSFVISRRSSNLGRVISLSVFSWQAFIYTDIRRLPISELSSWTSDYATSYESGALRFLDSTRREISRLVLSLAPNSTLTLHRSTSVSRDEIKARMSERKTQENDNSPCPRVLFGARCLALNNRPVSSLVAQSPALPTLHSSDRTVSLWIPKRSILSASQRPRTAPAFPPRSSNLFS
jgi:hypothetical protein